MRIVTAGQPFMDIDAYGGCIAYAELLNLQGEPAAAVSTAPFNASICPLVRAWDTSTILQRTYQPAAADTFTMIDLSEPQYFSSFVDLQRVDEIIDHHLGFEATWQHLGSKAHIEFVGAACTLVYERWAQANLLPQMSQLSARLLLCGILDNTLNLGAAITTDRDRQAYEALAARAGLLRDWPAQYFDDCQQGILQDLSHALLNDRKPIRYPDVPHILYAAQLALWDAAAVLDDLDGIRRILADAEPWYANIISIKDRCSYFVTDDAAAQAWLTQTLDVSFQGSVAKTKRLWLRKEIMQQAVARAAPNSDAA